MLDDRRRENRSLPETVGGTRRSHPTAVEHAKVLDLGEQARIQNERVDLDCRADCKALQPLQASGVGRLQESAAPRREGSEPSETTG
jgi:hypothetical protein